MTGTAKDFTTEAQRSQRKHEGKMGMVHNQGNNYPCHSERSEESLKKTSSSWRFFASLRMTWTIVTLIVNHAKYYNSFLASLPERRGLMLFQFGRP
jgi:hypothetical protein